MKFGHEIANRENPRFKGQYINYAALKKLLKKAAVTDADAKDGSSATDLTTVFLRALDEEIQKINKHAAAAQQQLLESREELDGMRRNKAVDVKDVLQREKELWHFNTELREFAELNYSGFYKIGKKHDKVTGKKTLDTVLEIVDTQPFMQLLEIGSGLGRVSQRSAKRQPRSLIAEIPEMIGGKSTSPASAAAKSAVQFQLSPTEFDGAPPAQLERISEDFSSYLNDYHGDSTSPVHNGADDTTDTPPHAASQEVRSVRFASRTASDARLRLSRKSTLASTHNLHSKSAAVEPQRSHVDTVTASNIAELLKTSFADIPDPSPTADLPDHQRTEGFDSPTVILENLAGAMESAKTQRRTVFDVFPGTKSEQSLTIRTPSSASEKKSMPPVMATLQAVHLQPADVTSHSGGSYTSTDGTAVKTAEVSRASTEDGGRSASSSIPWEAFDEKIAQSMLQKFDSDWKQAHRFADNSLVIMSPELEEDEVERYKRLAKFSLVLMKLQKRVHGCAERKVSIRQLHDGILSATLSLFRMLLSVLVREIDMTFPEGSAALEHVVQAHHVIFSPYMSTSVAPPPNQRVQLVQALRSHGRETSVHATLLAPTSQEAGTGLHAIHDAADVTVAVDQYTSLTDITELSDRGFQGRMKPSNSIASIYEGYPGDEGDVGLPLDAEGAATSRHANASSQAETGTSKHGNSASNSGTTTPLPQLAKLGNTVANAWTTTQTEITAAWPKLRQHVAVAIGVEEDNLEPVATPAPHGPKDVLRSLYHRWRPSIFEWLPSYNWKKHFLKDVIAGITIGVVVIPQGLAYATLAGVPPVYGVYTGFPSIIYAIFGTSRHAAIGPMSVPALLMATAVSTLDPPPDTVEAYIGEIMAMTFMCGLFLFILGWLNLGFVVRFISQPVLSGFTSAAAMMTILSVMKDFLGAAVPRSQVFQGYVVGVFNAIPHTDLPTIVTGIICILLLYFLPKIERLKKVPSALLVVCLSIILFAIITVITDDDCEVDGVPGAMTKAGIALVGYVPSSFPVPQLPPIERVAELLPAAISISFVGYIESIAVAKMYSVKYGYKIDASSELKALGLTNMGGAVLQSFVVMGAFGRSAVNEASGAKSQLSGVVATFVVMALLLFVMPALFYLPRATLAAMIIMAVWKLINFKDIPRLWRVDKRDLLIMTAALLATLFMGVLPGIVSAMLFSLFLFVAFSTQPQIIELGRVAGTVIYREIGLLGVMPVPDVKIIRFMAPLFFANCTVLKDRLLIELMRRRKTPPRLQWQALVLCFSSVSNIDSTSVLVLEEIIAECHAQKIPLLIAGTNASVEMFLTKCGTVDKLGGAKFLTRRVHEAVRAILLKDVTANDVRKPAQLASIKSSAQLSAASTTGSTHLLSRLMDGFRTRVVDKIGLRRRHQMSPPINANVSDQLPSRHTEDPNVPAAVLDASKVTFAFGTNPNGKTDDVSLLASS